MSQSVSPVRVNRRLGAATYRQLLFLNFFAFVCLHLINLKIFSFLLSKDSEPIAYGDFTE
jgi:hypothetical protein